MPSPHIIIFLYTTSPFHPGSSSLSHSSHSHTSFCLPVFLFRAAFYFHLFVPFPLPSSFLSLCLFTFRHCFTSTPIFPLLHFHYPLDPPFISFILSTPLLESSPLPPLPFSSPNHRFISTPFLLLSPSFHLHFPLAVRLISIYTSLPASSLLPLCLPLSIII